jgi:hypothetical protein
MSAEEFDLSGSVYQTSARLFARLAKKTGKLEKVQYLRSIEGAAGAVIYSAVGRENGHELIRAKAVKIYRDAAIVLSELGYEPEAAAVRDHAFYAAVEADILEGLEREVKGWTELPAVTAQRRFSGTALRILGRLAKDSGLSARDGAGIDPKVVSEVILKDEIKDIKSHFRSYRVIFGDVAGIPYLARGFAYQYSRLSELYLSLGDLNKALWAKKRQKFYLCSI